MRHLTKWKLFESNYKSLVDEVSDISLELSDSGMDVHVWCEESDKDDTRRLKGQLPNSYTESIQIQIRGFENKLLIIKEFIERVCDYLGEGYFVKCIGSRRSRGEDYQIFSFDYNNIKSNDMILTTSESRILSNDFSNLIIRFHKINKTYHIVRYPINFPGYDSTLMTVSADLSYEDAKVKLFVKKLHRDKKYDVDFEYVICSDKEYWNSVGDPDYFKNKSLK